MQTNSLIKKCQFSIILLLLLVTAGCENTPKNGAEETGYQPPSFTGIAYIQATCDHIAVINLADKRVSRIKLDKTLGGISLEEKSKTLFAGSIDGYLCQIDLQNGTKSDWIKIAQSISGTKINDAILYFLDTQAQKLVRYDLAQHSSTAEITLEQGKYSLSFCRANNTVYLSNASTSVIQGYDAETLKNVFMISSSGNSIHKLACEMATTSFWVAEGNEFKDGKPYGIGFTTTQAQAGGINVIVPNNREKDDFVYVGGNIVDIQFSRDSKYAFAAASRMPEHSEASLAIVDTKSKRVIEEYRLCNSCHVPKGVNLRDQPTIVSSLQIDWDATSFNKATTAMQ